METLSDYLHVTYTLPNNKATMRLGIGSFPAEHYRKGH